MWTATKLPFTHCCNEISIILFRLFSSSERHTISTEWCTVQWQNNDKSLWMGRIERTQTALDFTGTKIMGVFRYFGAWRLHTFVYMRYCWVFVMPLAAADMRWGSRVGNFGRLCNTIKSNIRRTYNRIYSDRESLQNDDSVECGIARANE